MESAKDSASQADNGYTCSTVFKSCLNISKYVILILAVPPFINYASLHQEAKELQPPGMLIVCCFYSICLT